MSEQRFKDARGALAFSQNLRSQLMPQMPPQATQQPQMPQDTPQEETTPTEPNQGVQEMIAAAIDPINKKLDQLLSMEKKEQEVELKIGGTMTPADETGEPKE